MKIIISPSKTKKIGNLLEINEYKKPIFKKEIKKIVGEISTFSFIQMENKFKLKEDKAKKLLEFYKNFDKRKKGHSLSSYSGIAFKSIGIKEFTEEDIKFAEKHLIILSALYGILTPLTLIKEYRLDMVNPIFSNKSLYEFWKNKINEYFVNEKCIINLASKEYSKIINSENIYNFEFYDNIDGNLKQISTNSKKMRGYTVNYIIKNKITKVENLKNISLNGYVYDKEKSSDRKYVYIK